MVSAWKWILWVDTNIDPPMPTVVESAKEPEDDDIELVEQPMDPNDKKFEASRKIIPMQRPPPSFSQRLV